MTSLADSPRSTEPLNNLYVIITDFNGYAQTRRCLRALRASRYRDFTILVVDHGTSEETRNGLAAEFPEVVHIVGSSELWWTGATNLGVQCALERGADALLLLNNDCYVTLETIGTLVKLACANPDAIIAPVQRDWQSGQVTAISLRSLFLLGFPTVPDPRRLTTEMKSRELLPVKLIGGGRGVIIPGSVFSQIGLFDEEQLPHYGADHDFYLRAHRRKIPLYIATRAVVDIDNTRTTLADNPGALSFAEFRRSLYNIRSHRNLRDVTALFRKHYPIGHLHLLGVALYTGRYVVVYLLKRGAFLLSGKRRKSE